jgi:hypothetical protein
MSETVRTVPSRLWVVAGLSASVVLTAFSGMLHGSGAEARLQGPSGWTGWVALDLLLAVLPILVAAISFVALVIAGPDRPSPGVIALTIWLASAFGSCALAVFWI